MRILAAVVLLLIPFCQAEARGKKIKKVKASDNPAEYLAFSQPLAEDDRLHHALDRLTFGPRPGDHEQFEQAGFDKWIDGQLHPERVRRIRCSKSGSPARKPALEHPRYLHALSAAAGDRCSGTRQGHAAGRSGITRHRGSPRRPLPRKKASRAERDGGNVHGRAGCAE